MALKKTKDAGKEFSLGEQEALLKACREGDIKKLRLKLAQDIDLNALVKSKGSRPLTDATRYGHIQIVELLLDSGADPDLKDTGLSWTPGSTALEIACSKGRLDIAKLLLRHGADMNRKGYWPPLMAAISHDQVEVVKFLLSRGAQWESMWLVQAVGRKGEVEIVRQLIAAGADVNQRSSNDGLTPLHFVVESRDPALTRLLLRAGAKVNVQSDYRIETPLSRAAKKGNLEVVRVLLEAGADVSLPGPKGKSAEHWARVFGHKEVAQFLREYARSHPPVTPKPRRASQSKARRQPAESQTSSQAVRTQIVIAQPAAANRNRSFGASDFVALVHEWGHPEWVVLAVEASLDAVAATYARFKPIADRKREVTIKASGPDDEGMAEWIPLVQPVESNWTVILRTVCLPIGSGDVEEALKDAAALSKQLRTRALSFLGEDTSFAMQCDLYDHGKAAGTESWDGHGKNADGLLKKLGLYIPACYSQQRGASVWLSVRPSSRGKIRAADLVLPKD